MFKKKVERFSIRKLSVGTFSVAIGLSLIALNNTQTVHAATETQNNTQENNLTDTQKAAKQVDKAQDDLKAGQDNNAQINQAKQTKQDLTKKINTAQTAVGQDQKDVAAAQTGQNAAQKVADKASQDQVADQKVADKASQDQAAAQKVADKASQDQNAAQKVADKAGQDQVAAQNNVNVNNDKQTQTKKTLDQTVNDYNKQVQNINDLTKKVNDGQAQVAQADQDLASAQKAQADKKAKADNAFATLTKAQDAVNSAKKTYDSKTKALSQTNNQITNETKALQTSNDKLNELSNNLTNLNNDLAKAQKAYQAALNDVKQNQAKLDDLAKKRQELQNSMNEAQSELAKAKQAYNDSVSADNNHIILSDTYKENVKKMEDIYKNSPASFDQLENGLGHPEWLTMRNQASNTSWNLSKFQHNDEDKKQEVDLDHISDSDNLRLTFFAAKLINNVRMQLGTSLLTVNGDAIKMAREIADEYNKDNRTNPDGFHHDARAINAVSKRWGIDHSDDNRIGNDPYVHPNQYIENMAGIIPGQKLRSGHFYHDSGWYEAPLTHHISMDDLKQGIYYNIKQFVLEPDEWGHMRNITETFSNAQFQDKPEYFGFSTSIPVNDYKNGASTHFILIPESYIQKDSKFNKNNNLAIPETSDLEFAKNNKQKTVDDLQSKLDDNQNAAKMAQSAKDDSLKQKDQAYKRADQDDQAIRTTQDDINSTKSSIENSQNKLKTLNVVKDNLENEIPNLLQDLTAKQAVQDKANSESTKANKDLDNAKAKTNNARADSEKAHNDLTNSQKALNDSKTKAQVLSQTKTDLTKTLQDLANKAQILNKDLADAKAKAQSAKTALDKANKAKADADKALAKAKDDNQAKTAALEKANKAKADSDKVLTEAKAQVTKTQAKLANDAKTLADLQAKLAKVNNFLQNASYADVDALTKALNDAKQNLANAKAAEAAARQAALDAQIAVTGKNGKTISTKVNKDVIGIAHVPSPKDMEGAELELVDSQGKPSGKYINTDSNWKVLEKKTINGQTYYRLGTDKQWISSKYVSEITSAPKPESGSEEQMSGTVHVPVINNNANYKVALRDSQGKVTGKYISTNSNWKVFAKKTINGSTYYRIGNEDQWIPVQFTSINNSNETKISGVAHVPTIHNNRNWKVALLDDQGHVTGKYISTNSNWKVFAKKTVNGRELVRLGTDLQWIPMEYVAWIR